MKAKSTIRVPLDQFAYIEKEWEDDISAEELIRNYHAVVKEYKGTDGPGISDKSFNDFLDSYLMGKMNGLGEIYAGMSKEQQEIVQCLKKSLSRIKAKQSKEEEIS